MSRKKNEGRFLKQNVASRNASQFDAPKQAPKKAPKKASKETRSNASMETTRKAPKAQNTARVIVALFTVVTVCVSLAACGIFLNMLGVSFSMPNKTIAGGVTVAGVDVGGLTKKEALEVVTEAVGDSYSTTALVANVLDQKLEITPAVSGANFDIEAAVNDAFRYGTPENPEKKVDILPFLNLNSSAIKKEIQDFSVQFPTEGTDSSYEITTAVIDGTEVPVLNLTIGSECYDFSADDLYDAVISAYMNHRFEAFYTCQRILSSDLDLDDIYAQVCKEPVDAALDPDTHKIVESVNGYRFDLEAAKEALAAANPGETLQFPFEEVLPKVDTETLRNSLFQDKLGTYTAKSSSSTNRDTNLRLACQSLNGLILYPGDVLDYNKVLGERTPEKGYKKAGAYMGSETIMTYGGGICQPSSVLYYCALMADLEIVERHNHGFISSYMPYGMDATVSWGGPEFKFRNNTNYPIRIDAEANGGSVTITLMGTDEKDYYVKMEYEVLSTSSPTTITKEVGPDSGHRDGEVETTPYTGYTVQTYKCKYDKETDALISREKEAYSVYSKRDKVVYKVVSTETTEPTTEPTTPSTEPSTEPTTPPPTEPSTEPTTPTEPSTAPTTPPVGEAGSEVELPTE